MAKKDMKTMMLVSVALTAAVVGAGTDNGVDIDMSDAESLTFALTSGAGGLAGNHSVAIQHADEDPENPGSPLAYEDVPADFVIGAAALAAGEDDTVKTTGYVGKKKFVRANLVSDAGSVAPVGITAIKGHLFDMPAA